MEGIGGLRHLFMTVFLNGFGSFMVVPAITDITMLALCPGRDACSLAIYLSGFQQAIIGVGTVVMTPVIGNLSDVYGRKSLLTIPMTLSIIPLGNGYAGQTLNFTVHLLVGSVIMAYSRETSFFYAYYVLRTVTALVGEVSINCLALAYVADNVSERERISAFAILAGITSAALVCGTLAARFLSTASTFQVAAFASILSTVYMRIFLKESLPGSDSTLRQPILKGVSEVADEGDVYSPKTIQVFKKIPSPGELISLLRSSKILSQAAVVSFFQSLAEGGMQASLLYFLKARFHFNKNQFADLMLIFSISGATSQLLFMPMLAPAIGEEKLLTIGLIMGSMSMFLNSISWAVWVPYAATLFNVFGFLVQPSIRSIASKQVGPHDQGKAQGCILGISSFANIVSPLLFSPLTALFLSEEAPFNFPGFSIMCIGLAPLIGFVQSLMIKASPKKTITNVCVESP